MPRGKQPVVVCLFTPVPARPSSCTLRWRHLRSASTSGTGSSVVRPKEKTRGPDLQRPGAALFSVEEWNSATLHSQALCTGRRRHASDPCDDTPRHERWQSSCGVFQAEHTSSRGSLPCLPRGRGMTARQCPRSTLRGPKLSGEHPQPPFESCPHAKSRIARTGRSISNTKK